MKVNKLLQKIQENSVFTTQIAMSEYAEPEKQNIAVCIHVNEAVPRYHCHDFFEINVVLHGQCTNIINNITLRMKKGDLVLIHSRTYHILTAAEDSVIANILIRADWFQNTLKDKQLPLTTGMSKFISSSGRDDFFNFVSFGEEAPAAYFSCIEKLIAAEAQGEPIKYLQMEALTIHLICLLLNHPAAVLSKQRGAEMDTANAIRAFMTENYSEVSLLMLAQHFRYSPTYICKILKSSFNMTFKEILMEIRLEKAKSYLIHTDKKIAEISRLLGYESIEYFYRMFKSKTSYTPKEFRLQFGRKTVQRCISGNEETEYSIRSGEHD